MAGDTHYHVLFVIGLVLFAITFVVNLVADLMVKGIRSDNARPTSLSFGPLEHVPSLSERVRVRAFRRQYDIQRQLVRRHPRPLPRRAEVRQPLRPSAWKNARRPRNARQMRVSERSRWLLIVPVVAILGCLLVKAWPVLGLSFILENPTRST